jgi:agmatinase
MDFDLGGPIFPNPSITAVDCGDLDWSEADAQGNRTQIREATAEILQSGVVLVLVGGDDSVQIPFLGALGAGAPTITDTQALPVTTSARAAALA